MGRDLFDTFELARRRYAEAAEILGFDLAQVCFDGPEEALRQTRITQPALYVHSCILSDLMLERGVAVDAAAGHSLGEYSALEAAKAFSFGEGLKLVKTRADAMQRAGEANPGTMAAIVGLADEIVESVCVEASSDGTVIPANYNSPGQTVISGSVGAVQRAIEIAKSRGAKIAKELPVSGAFHSPLMASAAESLTGALSSADLSAPKVPVISNVTARHHADVQSVRTLLAKQLLSPVRWTQSLEVLFALGEVRWFEVGSGTVLSGLLKRTIKGASAIPVGTVADLERIEAKAIAES